MTMSEQQRKRRGRNFCTKEEEILLNLVEKYKNIIENKQSDAPTWKEKERTWNKIATEFAGACGIERESRALRDKYATLKRQSKMELAAEKQQIYRENDKCANSASNLVITDVVSLDSSIAITPTNTTKTIKYRQPSRSSSTSTRLSPAFSESKKRKNSVNQLEEQLRQSTNDQEPVDELDAFGKYVVAEIRALHDPDAARRVRIKVARFLLDCIESENQMSEFKEETQSYF